MRLVANMGFEYLDGGPEISEQADRATNEALYPLVWRSFVKLDLTLVI